MTEKEYVIFWERLANAGVIESCKADSSREAVKKCGFNTDIVKHTVIEKTPGSKIVVIGKEG